ncbi:tetratricopeptide repeat protein [Eikenella sp. S3360]|uniref:Ancillary SecYEG translocon subunit n=1 Tax=Eikenella glucosivorans TaxID=2766967 RepID=A0ABS0N8W6_9NEIS|nr:tetratricopeptide repeat protein [Eikenella glucosivorans]MBH5328724.1 tetratricopeptide repeat protein [Eikenella glucosivorans]
MAAYDLKDQEEIENFKYFWRSWGRWLFALLVIAAIGYFGWVLYRSHQRSVGSEAVAVFDQWAENQQAGKPAEAAKLLSQLQSDYSGSVSAAQATLIQAGAAFDQGKYDEAAGHLNWVLKYHQDPLIRALAIQRLATVQLQQQKYDDALATLAMPADEAYAGILLETKGDVYAAQGKRSEAAAAYKQALDKLPQDDEARQFLQLKIDQMG